MTYFLFYFYPYSYSDIVVDVGFWWLLWLWFLLRRSLGYWISLIWSRSIRISSNNSWWDDGWGISNWLSILDWLCILNRLCILDGLCILNWLLNNLAVLDNWLGNNRLGYNWLCYNLWLLTNYIQKFLHVLLISQLDSIQLFLDICQLEHILWIKNKKKYLYTSLRILKECIRFNTQQHSNLLLSSLLVLSKRLLILRIQQLPSNMEHILFLTHLWLTNFFF